MKSATQTLTLLLVVVGLVGGMTFLSQWVTPTDDPPPSSVGKDSPTKAEGRRMLQFVLSAEAASVVSEMQPHKGYHDFWFENPHAEEVEVGLIAASCKCADVLMREWTTEQEQTCRDLLPVAAATVTGITVSGLGGWLTSLPVARSLTPFFDMPTDAELNGAKSGWRKLEGANPDKGGEEAPGVKVAGRAKGVVRVTWKGREPGPQRIKAALWMQPSGRSDRRGEATLEVQVGMVHPINVSPLHLALNDIEPGTSATATFYCFSFTRGGFKLTAKEERGDPCIRCELEQVPAEGLREVAEAVRTNLPVLSAYRVNVTAREQAETGEQLDLGPLARKIVLTGEEDYDPPSVSLTGITRGDVQVGLPERRDRVSFGAFDASRPAEVSVPVFADQPNVELVVESKFPEYFDVRLMKIDDAQETGARWRMTVRIPENRAGGPLPAESVIVLKKLGTPPRLIRVPVLGTALSSR